MTASLTSFIRYSWKFPKQPLEARQVRVVIKPPDESFHRLEFATYPAPLPVPARAVLSTASLIVRPRPLEMGIRRTLQTGSRTLSHLSRTLNISNETLSWDSGTTIVSYLICRASTSSLKLEGGSPPPSIAVRSY